MKITLEIDTRHKGAKSFLDFIQNLSFIKKVENFEVPNNETQRAIKQARENKTIKIKRKKNDIFEDILNS